MEAKEPNGIIESDFSKIQSFSGTPEELTGAERMLVEGKALQKVQTPYATAIAVQKPRSITRYVNNVLEECSLAGASFYYGWVAKTKIGPVKIEGPSIDLAMCLARHYGNCVIDIEGTENPTHFMLKGIFIDLESGFTCPRLFRQRKGQSMGMDKDLDRQEDIVFQIGQSKVIRNAIVRAMPKWLIERAIEAAKEAEIKKIKAESPAFARAKVLSFFGEYGVSQDRIEAKINKSADKWTAKDIAGLRANATALKEGRIAADELFPGPDMAPASEEKPEPEKPKEKETVEETSLKEQTEKEAEEILTKEELAEDAIRKLYLGEDLKGLTPRKFKIFLKGHTTAIPGMAPEHQNEIKGEHARLFPGQDFPVLIASDPPPVKDKPKKSEKVEETELSEEEKEAKILELVKDSKMDEALGILVPCPNRDSGDLLRVDKCAACIHKERASCPTWSIYDTAFKEE